MKEWLVVCLPDQQRKYRLNGDHTINTFEDFSDDFSDEIPLYFYNYLNKEYQRVYFYTDVERDFAGKGVNNNSES